jgi:hypothetical protein
VQNLSETVVAVRFLVFGAFLADIQLVETCVKSSMAARNALEALCNTLWRLPEGTTGAERGRGGKWGRNRSPFLPMHGGI